MKKMSVLGITAALFVLGLGNELQAGAILDPENLIGTVGLTDETFNSGYVYASWDDGSTGMELGSVFPQNFSLWVEKNKPVNLDIDMYSSDGTSDAYLRQSIKAVNPNSTPNLNLVRPSGRIEGTVDVTGGTVKSINMSSSVQISLGNSGYDESYRGLVRAAGSVAEQPMIGDNDIQVYGTAILNVTDVDKEIICSIPVDLASQSVYLSSGSTAPVDWSFELNEDDCDLGRIYGGIELKGLDSQSQVPGLDYHRVYVYKSPTFKKRELQVDPPWYSASYDFPGLADGNYDVNLISYFNPPYGFIKFQENDSVVNGSSVQHDFIKSVGTLHGEVQPEGFWGLDDLHRMIIGFRQGTMNQPLDSQDDADLSTGQFDLVVPEGDSYLYVDYFAFKNKNNGCRLFQQEAQRNYYGGPSYSPFPVSVTEGDDLSGNLEVAASLVNQEFHLSDSSVGIKRLDLKGNEITKSGNLWVKQNRIESLSDLTAGTPTNSVIVPLRGTPGIYNMTAEADGTDGKVYGASFKLELTAPQEYSGNPLTFSTITGGNVSVAFAGGSGYTNVGVSTVGPVFGAFKVVKDEDDPTIYYDIHSDVSVDTSNQATVCLPIPAGMNNPQILHYVCGGTCGSVCEWKELETKEESGQACADTDSFSIFTVVQPAISSYPVTPLAGDGGSISPDSEQTVDEGNTISFTITPDVGYHVDSVEGCGGILDGNTYTTGAINDDCTVTASFVINKYTVISSAGKGGTISPDSPQSVEHGDTTSFTVTPDTGYSIDKVEGCNGSLSGNTYTTGAITADCEVTAGFAININTTGQIVVKNYMTDKDVALFKMTGMADIGSVARDAADSGQPLTFGFGSEGGATIYSFTADSFDAAGNRLIYSDSDGNMLRCLFSTKQCVVRISYTDFDKDALDALLTGEMNVRLDIGKTVYSDTGVWKQLDSGSGSWTKYRKDN